MKLTQETRHAASKLASHGNKKRWSEVPASERSEYMRALRMKAINKIAAELKAKRPKSSDAWRQMNTVFLAENRTNRNKESK